MREILCKECTKKHLPEGTRKIYERSKLGEPAEYQRLIVGRALIPSFTQRTVLINNHPTLLDLTFYNCDDCNKEIRPGDECSCWSVWTEEQEPTPEWESRFIVNAS